MSRNWSFIAGVPRSIHRIWLRVFGWCYILYFSPFLCYPILCICLGNKWTILVSSGIKAGGRVPPDIFTGKLLLTYWEKQGHGRTGKWGGKEGKFEREEVENGRGKGMKMSKGFFFFLICFCVCFLFCFVLFCFVFFFCLSLFETTEICFGSTKMNNFTRKNHISPREKIRKSDFAPSEKYSSYASACQLTVSVNKNNGIFLNWNWQISWPSVLLIYFWQPCTLYMSPNPCLWYLF